MFKNKQVIKGELTFQAFEAAKVAVLHWLRTEYGPILSFSRGVMEVKQEDTDFGQSINGVATFRDHRYDRNTIRFSFFSFKMFDVFDGVDRKQRATLRGTIRVEESGGLHGIFDGKLDLVMQNDSWQIANETVRV